MAAKAFTGKTKEKKEKMAPEEIDLANMQELKKRIDALKMKNGTLEIWPDVSWEAKDEKSDFGMGRFRIELGGSLEFSESEHASDVIKAYIKKYTSDSKNEKLFAAATELSNSLEKMYRREK